MTLSRSAAHLLFAAFIFALFSIQVYGYVLQDPVNFVDPEGKWAWWVVIGGIAGGAIEAYQSWLDPCSSGGDVAKAFLKGAVVGALTSWIPITKMNLAAGMFARGAFSGAGGNILSGALNGEAPSVAEVAQSAAIGAASGGLGNMAGLHSSLHAVRKGANVSNALKAGDGIGTGVGVLGGTMGSALNFSPNKDCDCKK